MTKHPLNFEPAGYHGRHYIPAAIVKIIRQAPFYLLVGQVHDGFGIGNDIEFRRLLNVRVNGQGIVCEFKGKLYLRIGDCESDPEIELFKFVELAWILFDILNDLVFKHDGQADFLSSS